MHAHDFVVKLPSSNEGRSMAKGLVGLLRDLVEKPAERGYRDGES